MPEYTEEEIRDFRERRERAEMMEQLQKSPWWKELLIPEYKNFMESLENRALSERDPWRRYAIVEAILVLRELRMRLDDIAMGVKDIPKDANAIIAKIEGGYPIEDLIGPAEK